MVDDQETVRRALGDMLGVYGYAVDLYDSAGAFLNAAASVKPVA